MKKFYYSLGILLIVGIITVSLSAGVTAETLNVAKEQEAEGFDPHLVPASSSIRIHSHIYEGLVGVDKEGNIKPEIAEKWEIVDPTTYVFELRDDIKFHNGRKLTSEDVKYSFERIMDPDVGAVAKSNFEIVEEIKTPDDYTVIFELEEPNADLLLYMSETYASIVPEEVVEEHGDLKQETCGTGAFMLDEWEPDNYTSLVKNPDYYIEGQPKIDEIKYHIIEDESSRIASIRSGRIDVSMISADGMEQLGNEENIELVKYPTLDYTYLGFNTTVEPFDDPDVRTALSYALDREEIAENAYGGEAELTGPIPSANEKWTVPVSEYPSYTQDLEKAEDVLAEAGYSDGFEFTIKTVGSEDAYVDMAVIIQDQLAEIGVDVKIELVEWGTYIDAWRELDHDALVGFNGAGIFPDRSMRFFFHSEGTANVWGFSDEKIDELTEEAKVTIDEEERYELYEEAQKLLVNDLAPNLFLVSPNDIYAVNEKVRNFEPSALQGESTLFKMIELN
ncbi:MAG: ABC transporter substrate-binding protein [Bacillota bacterium]